MRTPLWTCPREHTSGRPASGSSGTPQSPWEPFLSIRPWRRYAHFNSNRCRISRGDRLPKLVVSFILHWHSCFTVRQINVVFRTVGLILRMAQDITATRFKFRRALSTKISWKRKPCELHFGPIFLSYFCDCYKFLTRQSTPNNSIEISTWACAHPPPKIDARHTYRLRWSIGGRHR